MPGEKTGRALGFVTAAFGLASPIGIAVGGVLAEAIGIAPFFLVDGLVCIVLGALVYLPKSVRALDHATPGAAAGTAPSAAADAAEGLEEA